MQLQKLVYIAHGFSLAVLGESLFVDKVHAWQYGPVIPPLYEELKHYGAGLVRKRLYTRTGKIKEDSREYRVIRAVWNGYGQFPGLELSAMTHKEGSPWSQTYKRGKRNEIPNSVIKEYYRQLLNVRLQASVEETAEYVAKEQAANVKADDALALAEQAELNKSADTLENKSPVRIAEPINSHLEMRWIAEHGHEYAGQWVALDGERLLSHGANAREVYEAARNSGVQLPLVVKIDPIDQLPFGGW